MIKTYKLSNGLTVVAENLPYIASATAGVWARAGAVTENAPVNGGISHYIEHMMFKGTGRRTYRQISEDIEKLGGSMNAFTGKECTCYYVKSLSSHLEESLDVLSDMLTASSFNPTEMEKEKNVVIEEMKMIEDVPDDWGMELITEEIFSGTQLANNVIGSRDTVRGISRDDILDYLSRLYTADNMLISIAGNFDEETLPEVLERKFGGIPKTASSAPTLATTTVAPDSPRRISHKRDIEQAHLFMGTRGLPYEHEDFYAMNLYSSILGGGMSSRLFQSVREEKGIAYSIFSADSPYVKDGQFTIYTGVAEEKLEAAVVAIKTELIKMAEEDVAPDELARVKEQYKGNLVFRLENSSSRMFNIGRNMLLLGKEITEDEILARIDAVTAADIRRLSQRFADIDSYSAVAIAGREFDLAAYM